MVYTNYQGINNMIDFNKPIINSNKFRQSAIFFEEHGIYCQYPFGTTEYSKYWDRETDRCLNGYAAEDGDWISGYNYFYLNYCPILRLIEEDYKDRKGNIRKRRVRDRSFADFYDYDNYYFDYVQECEETNSHGAVLKARGKGFSYKGASMLCRNYFLIPGSKSYAVASENEFLIKDGLLSKAREIMDFVDKHTAWAKKRLIDRVVHTKSGFQTTDELGNKTEQGYLSEIIGISLKDNPDRIRGKRGKLILWEEAGMFKNILQAWQIARPGVEEGDIAFGTMLAFGTGGSEGDDFEGLRELFYNPSGYNVLGTPNIWDENVSNTNSGLFIPAWSNMSVEDKDGNRIYMDKDGNSLVNEAMKFIQAERQKVIDGATNNSAVDRYIAENPICPQEACLELSGNIFPKKELQQQLAMIRTNRKLQSHKQVGDLIWVNGELSWQQKKHGDILEYPLGREGDPTGSIVIWEHPTPNPQIGLYLGGCLTPGEQVLTNRGLMNVEDVTLDDLLVSRDGKYVTIQNLQRYEKVNEDTYEIKVSNTYRTTNFTGEHPIYVSKDKCKSFDFCKARDLCVGDWIKYPNIYKQCTKIDIDYLWENDGYRIDRTIDSPLKYSDFWWFIGLWLGDGWCESDGYDISMSFDSMALDYIFKYKTIVKKLFNRKCSSRIRNGCTEIHFSFQQLSTFLTENFGKYAYGKYIPEWCKYINAEFKEQLILGYIASDGCIYQNKKTGYINIEFVSINHTLLESIQDILFSIEYISGITLLRPAGTCTFGKRICNTKPTYHLRIGHYDSTRFIINNNHRIGSKVNSVDTQNIIIKPRIKSNCYFSDDHNYIYFKIKNIKQDFYTGIVYNFECGTHTFVTRHISTHNCDPYDHDQAGTNSLGSTFIYKRFQNFEEYYDVIVAEYTGRPATAEDYYENVRKLLLYYNARLLYENERKGIFPYFTQKHCDYLLADQPDIITDIIGNSKVQRRKGIHMTKQIRDYGEGLIKEWLNEEYAPGKKNLTKILSEPLLEELIKTNGVMNVDRVIALIMVMIYREQLHNLKVKEVKEEVRKQRVFDLPIFTSEWFGDSVEDNTPVYTFG